MKRRVNQCLLALLVLLIGASISYAGTDLVRKREFIGFSDDGMSFLIKMNDTNMGTVMEYWKLKTDKPYKKKMMPEMKIKKFLKYMTKRKYKDKGARGGATEDGKYSVQHGPLGKAKYRMMIANEKGALAKFKILDVLKDKKSGKYAAAKIKEIIWDKSGRKMVVIFNQRIESTDWVRDFDTVMTFKVNPIYLAFKKLPE